MFYGTGSSKRARPDRRGEFSRIHTHAGYAVPTRWFIQYSEGEGSRSGLVWYGIVSQTGNKIWSSLSELCTNGKRRCCLRRISEWVAQGVLTNHRARDYPYNICGSTPGAWRKSVLSQRQGNGKRGPIFSLRHFQFSVRDSTCVL